MNCECFYLIKEGTLEAAREFVAKADEWIANSDWKELYPVCICKARKDFYACSDYDGITRSFKVKKDSIMVFVMGKYQLMWRMDIEGAKRGFPNRKRRDQKDFLLQFYSYVEDIEYIK